MTIEKYWIDKEGSGHNVIIVHNQTVFRKKAKKHDLQEVEMELKKGVIDPSIIGIPFNYMITIEFQENSKHIVIKLGKDSEDEITVHDLALRREIFNYIKGNSPVKSVSEETPSVFKVIKKPLIALGVVVAVFLVILYFIVALHQGYEFRITGSPGLIGIALMLAKFGLVPNALVFFGLGSIALIRIRLNLKKRSVMHTLTYKSQK